MIKIKKITSLFLAIALFFTFASVSSFADSSNAITLENFKGTYNLSQIKEGSTTETHGESLSENGSLIIDDNSIKLVTFMKDNITPLAAVNYNYSASYDYEGGVFFSLDVPKEPSEIVIYWLHFIIVDNNYQIDLGMSGPLPSGESFWARPTYIFTKETEPQEIETSFMHKTTTDSGQYDLLISGFLKATLKEGTNMLTSQEIAEQNISIFAKNNQTGDTRVLDQSTIEGITLNVVNGEIRSIMLKGRVQTPKGTFERYTTTVNL